MFARNLLCAGVLLALFCRVALGAIPERARQEIDRVFIVVFENKNLVETLWQPYFGRLGREGALLLNFHAETHPSQPNYIALTAGDLHGVRNNDLVNLDVRHIGDLLEEKGLSWKMYAEDYPGNCFLGAAAGRYVRKHAPFLSFVNVQRSPARCARVVNARTLDDDVARGELPTFSLYIPDQDHNAHDRSLGYADSWLAGRFGPLLANPAFAAGTLFVVTFDESRNWGGNLIYTSLVGAGVRAGSLSMRRYDHYSLLRTIEDIFGLGSLGQKDATAKVIDDIWKR